jgi:hypothetical protein
MDSQLSVRALHDLDFVAASLERIPHSLADEFLFRQIHPFEPPGKTMLQLVDPDARMRIDVFRACGATMSRTSRIELAGAWIQIISLEDLSARATTRAGPGRRRAHPGQARSGSGHVGEAGGNRIGLVGSSQAGTSGELCRERSTAARNDPRPSSPAEHAVLPEIQRSRVRALCIDFRISPV